VDCVCANADGAAAEPAVTGGVDGVEAAGVAIEVGRCGNEVEGAVAQAATGCVAAGEDSALALRQILTVGEAAAGVAAGGGTEAATAVGAGASDAIEDEGRGGKTVNPDGAAEATGCVDGMVVAAPATAEADWERGGSAKLLVEAVAAEEDDGATAAVEAAPTAVHNVATPAVDTGAAAGVEVGTPAQASVPEIVVDMVGFSDFSSLTERIDGCCLFCSGSCFRNAAGGMDACDDAPSAHMLARASPGPS
jgi:hypothetical protein